MKTIYLLLSSALLILSSMYCHAESKTLDNTDYFPYEKTTPSMLAGSLQIFNEQKNSYVDICDQLLTGIDANRIDITDSESRRIGKSIEVHLAKKHAINIISKELNGLGNLDNDQLVNIIQHRSDSVKTVFHKVKYEEIKNDIFGGQCLNSNDKICDEINLACKEKLSKLPLHYFSNEQVQLVTNSISSQNFEFHFENGIIEIIDSSSIFVIGSKMKLIVFYADDDSQGGGSAKVRTKKRNKVNNGG